MVDEQFSSASKMLVVNSGDQKPAPAQISVKPAARGQNRLMVDFSHSHLQCKSRFHFYKGEARDYVFRSRFRENAIEEVTADLLR